MPRNVDPANIQTGAGISGSSAGTLTWDTFGTSPIIGHLGPDQPHSYDPGQLALMAIKAHVQDVHNAHMAVAIGVEDATPPQFISDNVEGVVRELFAATLPPPPMIGQTALYTSFTGIPDWGMLKMGDCSIRLRDPLMAPLGGILNTNAPGNVFPYFLRAPTPTTDASFPIPGSDPSTDLYWNGPSALPVSFTTLIGWCSSGAVTLPSGDVLRTRVIPEIGCWFPVALTGTVFPADRGVLALLHVQTGGNATAFLAQPLLKRCIAAILLGQGLEGDACIDPAHPTSGACDGGPGGIFDIGHVWTDPYTPYNPFAFPGRATGQYNLAELHLGTSVIDGSPLNFPWNTPKIKAYQSRFGAWGQVRLGSDPDAGPVVDWGIPILGGKDYAYDESVHSIPTAGAAPYTGEKYIGDSLISATNFFSYRLPCLGDYSLSTGLKYTPRGVDPSMTRETCRYFVPEFPYDVPISGSAYQWQSPVPPWAPVTAGNYTAFDEDYWTWQIARYRHVFVATGTTNTINTAVPPTELLGTYWLTHFKSEKDFEQFVLAGTVPTSVYSAKVILPVDTNGVVNTLTTTSQFTPFGPAPLYAQAAPTYHEVRRELALGGILSDLTVAHTDFVTSQFGIDQLQEFLMWVSGVAYFVPCAADGTSAVTISTITVDVQNAWKGSYRTDDSWGTGDPAVAPTVVSSPCPAMLSLAPFSFSSTGGFPSYIAPSVLLSTSDKARKQRIELGYTVLGSNGGDAFSESNGPLAADDLTITLTHPSDPDIVLAGDTLDPSFSADAALRTYIRKPSIGVDWEHVALPAWDGTGPAVPGQGHRVDWDDGRLILFHSTYFNSSGFGKFGNFATGGPTLYPFLFSQDKDTGERFLDEVYRYRVTWASVILPADEKAHLVGPGMAGWGSGPLPVPVRPDATLAGKWLDGLWIWLHDFEHTLLGNDPGFTHLASELQVAGLPDRNPPIGDWVTLPFPSAGLLRYPIINYSAGYAPSVAEGAPSQPDYTTCTGTRGYVRAFDAAFSHAGSLPAVPAAGQPFVVLRIDGLNLTDIAYDPGPLASPNIFVKIPGLTTWMNIGRADGAGPSKQDPALDGAGCMVVGPHTFSSINTETGFVYCQIEVNVGPVVNLAVGQGNEVPVLVKVVMPEFPAGEWDLTKEYDPSTGIFGPKNGPGLHCDTIRGLVGIKIVHPTLVETAP